MKKSHIIFIDDQIDVLSTLRTDLKIFQDKFILDDCESADEAMELLEELECNGEQIALIISDHIMPNRNGIDFLSDISKDDRFEKIHRILITGQASHSDTINAINNASIDFYISKPWNIDNLHKTIKTVLTNWILENDLNYQEYIGLIDTDLLFKHMHTERGIKH